MLLDWSNTSHWNRGQSATCRWCDHGCWTLDSAGRPAHKSCIEALCEPDPTPTEPVKFLDLGGIISALGGKCPVCYLFTCVCEVPA